MPEEKESGLFSGELSQGVCPDHAEQTAGGCLGGAWLRCHHVFKEGALAELIECHIPELHITHSYFNHANWCEIAEKTKVWKI